MAIMTLKSRRVKRPSAMLMKLSTGGGGGGSCGGGKPASSTLGCARELGCARVAS